MKDHFSDDNFIEAAKVYQSIKAPSDLKARILTAAETPQTSVQKSAEKTGNRKQVKGRILQLVSAAACLAIMVVAVPDWQDQPQVEGPGNTARIISEPEGMPGQAVYDPAADPEEFLESQIPDIFGPEADLEAMEITMVSQDDTHCTAEVKTEDSITMEVTLEKNEETGCWEVTGVREKA